MWEPNTVQVPTSVVKREQNGELPSGTTLALAALLMTRPMPNATNVQGVDPTAAKVARKFLETGLIVTEDGEILDATPEAESPSAPTPNPATAPQDSNPEIDRDAQVTDMFRASFPDHVTPTIEQIDNIWKSSKEDMNLIADILLIGEHSSKPILAPPGFTLYMLGNKPHDKLREEAEILRRKDSHTPETIVARALKKAEQQIKELPDPGPNPARTERLRKLSEARSGRP